MSKFSTNVQKCCEISPFLRVNRDDYIKIRIFVYYFK